MTDPAPDDRDDPVRDSAPDGGEAFTDYPNTPEIFHRVLASAREELDDSAKAMLLGSFTAGVAVAIGFLARCTLTAAVGDAGTPGGAAPSGYDPGNFGWAGDLLYPVGFIFVILGRYPLFTENTLTPVALTLARLASVPDLLRVWGLSLAGNLAGAAAFAGLLVWAGLPTGAAAELAPTYGTHLIEVPFWESFARALVQGWLMAQLVWVVHAARRATARVAAVFLVLYVSAICGLFHCVTGTAEVVYAVLTGHAGWGDLFGSFLAPVVTGNVVGGSVFVAVLNWGQSGAEAVPDEAERLGWRDWLLGSVRDS